MEHILRKIDSFQHDLKDRMLQDSSFHIELSDMKNSCINFVQQKLSQQNYWGGMESMNAVAELRSVNILVVNDDGTCNIGNRFHPNHKHVLIISYRKVGNRENKRKHYDSVVNISDCLQKKLNCENFVVNVG